MGRTRGRGDAETRREKRRSQRASPRRRVPVSPCLLLIQVEEMTDGFDSVELSRRVVLLLESLHGLVKEPRRKGVQETSEPFSLSGGGALELQVPHLLEAPPPFHDRRHDREVTQPCEVIPQLLFHD